MLVEASKALAASTRANRPHAIVEHAALVSPDLSGQCLGDPGGEPTGSVGMGSVQGASGVQGAPCLDVQGVTLSELVRLNSWLNSNVYIARNSHERMLLSLTNSWLSELVRLNSWL